MKVRFYKGPYHNKTREVPDHMYDIVVSQAQPRQVYADNPYAQINVYTHRYTKSRHTHPDGSVFFVYEGKS